MNPRGDDTTHEARIEIRRLGASADGEDRAKEARSSARGMDQTQVFGRLQSTINSCIEEKLKPISECDEVLKLAKSTGAQDSSGSALAAWQFCVNG